MEIGVRLKHYILKVKNTYGYNFYSYMGVFLNFVGIILVLS